MVRAEVVDEETRLFWSTRVGKDVSEEDVREISENLVGFVTVLHAWESSKKMKAAEEQRSPGNGCKDSFTSMGKMVLQ